VCAKERNRISTQAFERKRLEAGYGDSEAEERDDVVSDGTATTALTNSRESTSDGC
jgi:hypothetical protein